MSDDGSLLCPQGIQDESQDTSQDASQRARLRPNMRLDVPEFRYDVPGFRYDVPEFRYGVPGLRTTYLDASQDTSQTSLDASLDPDTVSIPRFYRGGLVEAPKVKASFGTHPGTWGRIQGRGDTRQGRRKASSIGRGRRRGAARLGPMVPVTSVGEPTAAPLDTEAGRQHPESFQELTEALMNG